MNFITALWDFFASVKLAIFTLCSLAVTSIIGTIIPQGESLGFYAQRYGAKTAHFFQILDVGDMYYSWWFLGLLGLLCANLIICSFERFPRVWKIIHTDNTSVSCDHIKKMANSRTWNKNNGAETTLLANLDVSHLLKETGWNRSNTTKTLAEGDLYFSQKGKWSRTGVYIVHLSIIVIFIGAIVGHFWGFKGSVMIPEMSSTKKIYSYENSEPIDLGFEIRNDKFVIEFYENGMPKEYRSSLTVLDSARELYKKDIEVNSPLTHKGITFYQSSYQGYQDFIFTISDKASATTARFTVPFQKQDIWPEKSVQFGVVNAEVYGQRVVRLKIWFKAGNEPAVIEWLEDNGSTIISVGEKEYEVSAKQMYATGLQVAKDPGVWIVYLGCGLMLLGLYMAFFLSHTRIWILKENTSDGSCLTLAGSSNKNKLLFKKIFHQLEQKIDAKIRM